MLKNIAPKKGLIITKTATVTNNTKSEQKSPESNKTPENSLDKLDKVVERLDPKNNSDPKTSIPLPKIPKSLTVIPQMVARKPSRPSSPVLFITQKQKSAVRSWLISGKFSSASMNVLHCCWFVCYWNTEKKAYFKDQYFSTTMEPVYISFFCCIKWRLYIV